MWLYAVCTWIYFWLLKHSWKEALPPVLMFYFITEFLSHCCTFDASDKDQPHHTFYIFFFFFRMPPVGTTIANDRPPALSPASLYVTSTLLHIHEYIHYSSSSNHLSLISLTLSSWARAVLLMYSFLILVFSSVPPSSIHTCKPSLSLSLPSFYHKLPPTLISTCLHALLHLLCAWVFTLHCLHYLCFPLLHCYTCLPLIHEHVFRLAFTEVHSSSLQALFHLLHVLHHPRILLCQSWLLHAVPQILSWHPICFL